MNDYYVYILRNPLNSNEPFYVGKGRGSRATSHFTRTSSKHQRGKNERKEAVISAIKTSGVTPTVDIYLSNLSEEAAFNEERRLIAELGRKDIDAGGILTNLSAGGDGNRRPPGSYAGTNNPFYGRKHSIESRELISKNNASTGFNKKHSDETKRLISQKKKGQPSWMKGKRHTPETLEKMAYAKEGKTGPWAGKHRPVVTREKIRQTLLVRDDTKSTGIFDTRAELENFVHEMKRTGMSVNKISKQAGVSWPVVSRILNASPEACGRIPWQAPEVLE